MKVLNLLAGFAKSNGIVCLIFFGIVTLVFLQSRSEMRSMESQLVADVESKHSRLIEKILDMNTVNRGKHAKVASYSQWPRFSALQDQEFLDELIQASMFLRDKCLNGSLSIETFDQSLEYWRRVAASERPMCYDLLEKFESLYEVSAGQSHLTMPDELAEKAKGWLNNNEALFAKMTSQKLLTVTNKYTHEQNVYNWLRSKRPSQASSMSPKDL